MPIEIISDKIRKSIYLGTNKIMLYETFLIARKFISFLVTIA